jgi:hypothetical protein
MQLLCSLLFGYMGFLGIRGKHCISIFLVQITLGVNPIVIRSLCVCVLACVCVLFSPCSRRISVHVDLS